MPRILIAYGSRGGATAEVADAMADEMRKLGIEVDVMDCRNVREIRGYSAVLVGSSVWADHLHPGILHMMRTQEQVLAGLPLGIFVVCLTVASDDPEERKKAAHYLDRLELDFPALSPIARGLFAGAITYKTAGRVKPSLFERFVLMLMRKRVDRDARDWEGIRAFARDFAVRVTQG